MQQWTNTVLPVTVTAVELSPKGIESANDGHLVKATSDHLLL